MRILIGLMLTFGFAASHAAVMVLQCPAAGVGKYATVTPDTAVPIVLSLTANGVPTANLRCQALATAADSWFVKVSTDYGTSWNWETVALLKGSIQPPTVSKLPSAAVISWLKVTNDTSGNPMTVPITYNLYRGTSATALTKLTNVSALTYTDPAGGSTPTTYYYAVTATCAGCQESGMSNVVSTTIASPALTPLPPASVAIAP